MTSSKPAPGMAEREPTRVLNQDEIDSLLGFDERVGWSIAPLFAWYDLWIGAFWDRKSRKLYILPLPCVGVVIQFPKEPQP